MILDLYPHQVAQVRNPTPPAKTRKIDLSWFEKDTLLAAIRKAEESEEANNPIPLERLQLKFLESTVKGQGVLQFQERDLERSIRVLDYGDLFAQQLKDKLTEELSCLRKKR